MSRSWHKRLWLIAALLLYLALTTYQLGLPGLHYDEAREAGVNAMEILTEAPPSLFRNTGITLFGRTWPIMVQDYIGAANVYLALPSLWLTGIGVPNLRIQAILTGFCTLLLLERVLAAWQALTVPPPLAPTHQLPLSSTGLVAVTLLAASPAFVFWSRQGIFVTNLTQPLVLAMLWQGLHWLRIGRARALLWAAFYAGCALYAKLLAIWVVGPFGLLFGGWWLVGRWRGAARPALSPLQMGMLLLVLLLPLSPFFWFNLVSGGTVQAITANLGTSYYGIDNLAIVDNLGVRATQFRQMLTGEFFWYLGGLYGNPVAWWGTVALLGIGWLLTIGSGQARDRLFAPLLLLTMGFGASLFTLSDLFITHYALLQPLTIGVVAMTLQVVSAHLRRPAGRITAFFVLLWLLLDLTATLRYHRALNQSGGLADHSDATYHLAYYLQYHGMGAPLALDWGFDAPVRYLSSGTVTPIELFGYGSLQGPEENFQEQLRPFLGNPTNVYLLHTPATTVFAGRREQFFQLVADGGQEARLEQRFSQRDGTPLYELWRVPASDRP